VNVMAGIEQVLKLDTAEFPQWISNRVEYALKRSAKTGGAEVVRSFLVVAACGYTRRCGTLVST
jgi:hypothetical protein